MSTDVKEFDITYDGWAPCVHTDEHKQFFPAWVDKVMGSLAWGEEVHEGGRLEALLWALSDLDASVSLDCDQWTAVTCEGRIGGKTVRTRIQGDTFLASVAESYRWWRDETEQLSEH